ncbi:MAG: XRE family transcriptional regulator [Deltaproteobacteria bacterium]|nr:MAG: XRE family transcriptional regulator [Deltaproteobacteria bacterium]
MATPERLGTRIRSIRRQHQLTQKQMAERLEISPSYLNLIEHGKRPLSAQVLIKLAQRFAIDLGTFASDDAQAEAELLEVFSDPLFDELGLTNSDVKELVTSCPGVGEAVLTLYRAFREAREAASTLASRMSGEGDGGEMVHLPTEEVHDFIQRQGNYFPRLEEAAERLRRRARIEDDNRYQRMADYLENVLGVRITWVPAETTTTIVRRFDAERRVLFLSQLLPPRSRHFQLAHQLGLLEFHDLLDELTDHRALTSDEARRLARVTLANYFAAAVLMPYDTMLEEAERRRYDIELLGHRFRASFEQICHRLCTLRRPGAEGVPFHMIRVDIAGNISKRFSGSGIHFARYSGACPRWNVHAAFLTPGRIRTQMSVMEDGTGYFCVARTVTKSGGGWTAPHAMHAIGLGCALSYAPRLVYADGYDVSTTEHAVPVGVTCRLCERRNCPQRAFPPLSQRLQVDENIRGINLYAPVGPGS